MAFLSSGNDELNMLLQGGIEQGRITEFSGHSCTGKTQIIHQLLVNSQDIKKDSLIEKALHVDTNGEFSPDRIVQLCRAKGLDYDQVLKLASTFLFNKQNL